MYLFDCQQNDVRLFRSHGLCCFHARGTIFSCLAGVRVDLACFDSYSQVAGVAIEKKVVKRTVPGHRWCCDTTGLFLPLGLPLFNVGCCNTVQWIAHLTLNLNQSLPDSSPLPRFPPPPPPPTSAPPTDNTNWNVGDTCLFRTQTLSNARKGFIFTASLERVCSKQGPKSKEFARARVTCSVALPCPAQLTHIGKASNCGTGQREEFSSTLAHPFS